MGSPDDQLVGAGRQVSAGLAPPAKRARAALIKHTAHADQYFCLQTLPLRSFRFDFAASGPAGQQASLERQGWNGETRECVRVI